MTNDELKQEYWELYNIMSTSKNVKYMMCFGKVTTEMIDWFIANKKELAEEWIGKLESIRWDNYLTELEAKTIVSKMQPKSPWNYDIWASTMEKYKLPIEDYYSYNKYALWTAMSMVYSDSIDSIAEILNMKVTDMTQEQIVHATYKLACDKLMDADHVFNIRKYFNVLMDNDKRMVMLLNLYQRLNKEDRELMLFYLSNYRYNNMMNVLAHEDSEISTILKDEKRHNFIYDFAANIAGNLVTDAFVALLSKAFGKIRL